MIFAALLIKAPDTTIFQSTILVCILHNKENPFHKAIIVEKWGYLRALFDESNCEFVGPVIYVWSVLILKTAAWFCRIFRKKIYVKKVI